jgi:hypothetical protein
MLNPAQKTQVYQIMIGRCMNLPAGHTTNEKLLKVLIPDFIMSSTALLAKTTTDLVVEGCKLSGRKNCFRTIALSS